MTSSPDFTLHLSKKPEIDLISRMEDLAIGLPWMPKLSQVYLIKDPRNEKYFLASTDSHVMRLQRIDLFWTRDKLQTWSDERGPMTHKSHLGAWLEQNEEILPDLSTHPLRLGKRAERKSDQGTRVVEAWKSNPEDLSTKRLVPLFQGHIRPFPESFRPWLQVMTVEAMSKFGSTFIGGMEPPVIWISEPQVDLKDPTLGITWSKYWAYHCQTQEPLGMVMGVSDMDLIKKLRGKK